MTALSEPDGRVVAILPLRNSVLFPRAVVPINVGRPRSVRLVEELMAEGTGEEGGPLIGVVSQHDPETVEPTFEDLHEVGTLARIVKVIRLGAGNYSVVLQGEDRFRVIEPAGLEPYMRSTISVLAEAPAPVEDAEVQRLFESFREQIRLLITARPKLEKELTDVLQGDVDPGAFADLIAANLPEDLLPVSDRQRLLEDLSAARRLSALLEHLERHVEVLRVRDEISLLVKTEMSRSQRDYVLRQQLRDIKEELGESLDDDEVDQLRGKIARAELPPEAAEAARKQLGRLASMQPQSSEYQVTRNYVEWLADLPWMRTTPDCLDVASVKRCLDEDHWGLDRVKRRIVEYAAIRQLRRDKKGPILLFCGPPGVGKTSLGKSIARAMGRRYGRIALGGVRDEAEVRGHRRTYVGALPGRIIQALKKVGTRNPVLVLDEVDKMGADVRGDPASALLEVLDPAQNDEFVDHYIGVPFDLSEVTFLATANYKGNIPAALKDRMELIDVPGYTRNDKLGIARSFLVPKQLEQHALDEGQIAFADEGLESLIDHYTREAGVRGLEREIAAVCRDATVRIADGKTVEGVVVDGHHVEAVLGAARFRSELPETVLRPGVATGLLARGSGGDILFVEAMMMPGKGKLRITGKLGDVMRESAETAVSFVRSRAERLHLSPSWMEKIDLHVHLPKARVARDAAGSGVTIFVAVASLLLGASVRADVAIMGELTLRGRVLPIDDVKDKLLAAHRAGIREIVLPKPNERDLDEVPGDALKEMRIHLVAKMDEVLPLVLAPPPSPAEAPSPAVAPTAAD